MLILQFNIYFIALIYKLHTDTGRHFFRAFPLASISSRYIKQQTTQFFPFYYFSTFQTFFFAFHLGFSSTFLFILFPTQHFSWLTDAEEPPPTPQIAVDTSENFYISVIPECQEKSVLSPWQCLIAVVYKQRLIFRHGFPFLRCCSAAELSCFLSHHQSPSWRHNHHFTLRPKLPSDHRTRSGADRFSVINMVRGGWTSSCFFDHHEWAFWGSGRSS